MLEDQAKILSLMNTIKKLETEKAVLKKDLEQLRNMLEKKSEQSEN